MKTWIYALICPLDKTVKYIGKANNPERRAKDHMIDQRGIGVKKLCWLDELKRAGKKPELLLLDEVSADNWQYWESFYQDYYKSLGFNLLSSRSGGGLTYANSQTFKKGNQEWKKR